MSTTPSESGKLVKQERVDGVNTQQELSQGFRDCEGELELKLGGIEISIPVTVFLKYRGIPVCR